MFVAWKIVYTCTFIPLYSKPDQVVLPLVTFFGVIYVYAKQILGPKFKKLLNRSTRNQKMAWKRKCSQPTVQKVQQATFKKSSNRHLRSHSSSKAAEPKSAASLISSISLENK